MKATIYFGSMAGCFEQAFSATLEESATNWTRARARAKERERSEQLQNRHMIKDVAFVAIAVSGVERARRSYQETLELSPARTRMNGAWVEYDLGEATIGVGCHPAWKPSTEETTVAFEVDDFDPSVAKLKERGVVFDVRPMEMPICWMRQFRDPDGNKLLVHKRNPK